MHITPFLDVISRIKHSAQALVLLGQNSMGLSPDSFMEVYFSQHNL